MSSKAAKASKKVNNPSNSPSMKSNAPHHHGWVKWLAAVLLAGVIVVTVVLVVHYNRPGPLALSPLNLRKYPVCTADNANTLDDGDPTIRCMTDDDIRIINKASFTPLDDGEADRMDDLLERHTGRNGADDYGVIQTKSADRIKALLDWQLFYSGSGSIGNSFNSYQLASTIEETPTSYIYTYYRNQPARAECQREWDGPDDVIPHNIPRYTVELGGSCKEDERYVEYRGQTLVNTITINKSDMAVPMRAMGGKRVKIEDPESTLIHDSTHYVDFGEHWCESQERCRS